MRVLYGVCSWGLGHASRSLPIIRRLMDEENDITIISSGSSLELLKMELKEKVDYYDLADYPLPYTEKSHLFILKFGLFVPRLINSIMREHQRAVKYIEKNKFHLIISDNRYGIFHRKIPSFLITHQLRMIAPARFRLLENGFERFNAYFQKYFKNFMIPDYEKNGISGDLSHNLNRIDSEKVKYFGIVSDFQRMDVKEDVDYLISISGPEPQRQVLEDLMFSQVNDIPGNIVLSLGRPLKEGDERKESHFASNIQLYEILPKDERERILNRSKFIISRSGYSTIMDIYALGKKAMFIPTPQQTEQEYLARYHDSMGNFHYITQDELSLKEDLKKAEKYRGPDKDFQLDKNIKTFLDTVYS